MRCKNCGWENEPDRLNCEKCNAPLSGSAMSHHEITPTDSYSINLKGTVSEDNFFGSRPANTGEPEAGPSKCNKCGYPVGRGMNVCPMCGTPVGDNAANHRSNTNGNFGDPNQVSPSRQGTVNPWTTPQSGASCSLKPLAWDNEAEHEAVHLSGNKISLNRANTDPGNNTITSGEQAELTFEDGAWYICDKSYQKTTYVHASRKMKLEKGDIIILGNRRFEFNS